MSIFHSLTSRAAHYSGYQDAKKLILTLNYKVATCLFFQPNPKYCTASFPVIITVDLTIKQTLYMNPPEAFLHIDHFYYNTQFNNRKYP